MKPLISMRAALADPDLFGSILTGESWAAWRVMLIAISGETLNDEERAVFACLTGRDREPLRVIDETWLIIGRRGGKTRAIAVLAVFLAFLVDHSAWLAIGDAASSPCFPRRCGRPIAPFSTSSASKTRSPRSGRS